jgi:hypothetical protein
MKALSIRQPWVEAILHHGKRIENRDWGFAPRSMIGRRFWLHASAGCTRREYEEALHWMIAKGLVSYRDERVIPRYEALVRGALVGQARLERVILPGEPCDSPWYVGGLGLVLTDVTACDEPISYKGSLGFFEVLEQGHRRSTGEAF